MQKAAVDAESDPSAQSPGRLHNLFSALRNWTGRVRSWASRHLLPGRRRDINSLEERVIEVEADIKEIKADVKELKSDVTELKAGQARLEEGQAELNTRVGHLEKGQEKLMSGQARLEEGQAEMLGYYRDDSALLLEEQGQSWSTNGFPMFWGKRMQNSPGTPHGRWVPRLRPVGFPWHDRRAHSEWNDFRKDLRIPESVAAGEMPADLLMRFDYNLADGTGRSFLLLGEVARQTDGGDLRRLFDRSALLRDAGVDDPIVLCLFSQAAIENPKALAQIEEHHILHLYRAPRLVFHSWEDDAQRKLRHILGWN